MSRRDKVHWRERMHELLRLLGEDKITLEQFWSHMKDYGLSDEHIDRYCRGER